MPAKLIAILDDEPDIVELVAIHLKKSGFATHGFCEPPSFFRFIKSNVPALIILDLMLPGIDGFEICKQLKRDNRLMSVPVIMLTAKSDETDKILGLELGADDYITKPFSPKELVVRVKVVLRRHAVPAAKETTDQIGGILSINKDKFEVLVRGRKVVVTTTEFKILELIASKPGHVFSRDQILDHLWGEEKVVLDRTIDVHIRNLRAKLGKAGTLIKNIRGVGYKLEYE
jgi:two-component system phosphate regulon response regulator PhoB/two-component system alkaline phosphatase synthesis response regulator PhoP